MVRCPSCASDCAESHSYCAVCGSKLDCEALTPPEDPLIGSTLPGGYRITRLVGVGAMGRVYCAEQMALGRTVAVKMVHPHLAHDELAAARFLNEARAASRLAHPHSVAIIDYGQTHGAQPYIVMEYLRGQDLGRIAKSEGPMPIRRVVDILGQTLDALDEAHALGIVHRDLKPDNIVIESLHSGVDFVKVVDFGLAKWLGNAEGRNAFGQAQTQAGFVCGTPEYMSPEQSRGDPLDGRSDLYSVGVILFELLTGQVPFEADTPTKTLILQLTEPPPDPRDRAPERAIPPAFAELALRALAKEPEERVQTATSFAELLELAWTESEGGSSVRPRPQSTGIRCIPCGRLSPVGQRYCGECGIAFQRIPSPSRTEAAPREAFALPPALLPTVPAPPRADGEEAVGAAGKKELLIEREDALAWLEERFASSATMPAVAHLVGEPGIGRTFLLRYAAAVWASRGARVAVVAPDLTWAKPVGGAVREAIALLVTGRAGPLLDAVLDEAPGSARPGLAVLLGREDARTPRERRAAVAEALRWALECGAARSASGRVVLAVDDLDFVDGTSRNAFADVMAELPAVPALVAATYMPGTRPTRSPDSGESCYLAPLSAEYVRRYLGPALAPPGAALSPLHVEHLAAWAREIAAPPPAGLIELLEQRFERLDPDARGALHSLAVWGEEASPALLQDFVANPRSVGPAAAALLRAGLATRGANGLSVAHPLVRSVVFSRLQPQRKRELFALAGALRPSAPLELRARHAVHGSSTLEALALLDAVSTKRAAHGDLDGSVSALRRALDLSRREIQRGELDDPLTAILVFARKLAEALVACQRWADAEGVLHEALGLAPPTSEHRAHLLGVLAHVAHGRLHPGEARKYLDEAMRAARQSDLRGLIPLLESLDRVIAVA